MKNADLGRAGIIDVITSPLGFFALCLLTVEGFLGISLIYSDFETELYKLTGMIVGAILFLVVVFIVAFFVWNCPEKLTFKESSWLMKAEMERSWATEEKPATKREIEKEKVVSVRINDNIDISDGIKKKVDKK